MHDQLKRVEAIRYEATQILAEGREKRYPLMLSVIAVRLMFRKNNLPEPDDVLAFVSNGKVNMTMVDNWHSPDGR